MKKISSQRKTWGGSAVGLYLNCLGFVRLKYCLKDLREVEGRVLDLGCGGGGFAKAIKFYRSDLTVFGVDVDKKAIDKARKDRQGVVFRVGDIYKLPFKDGYFDAVAIEDVLEHLERPSKALKEVKRVLKPGGVFHLFVPLEGEPYALHYWLDKFGWKFKEKLAGHIQRFKRKDLDKIFKDNRFSIERERFSSHLLGQAIDIGYYSLAGILKFNLETGLEEYLEGKRTLFRLMKNFLAILMNLESMLFASIPASGIHILAIKTIKK